MMTLVNILVVGAGLCALVATVLLEDTDKKEVTWRRKAK